MERKLWILISRKNARESCSVIFKEIIICHMHTLLRSLNVADRLLSAVVIVSRPKKEASTFYCTLSIMNIESCRTISLKKT